jgi:polyhydroxyalkanoate synthesis regulator phasin
MNDEQTNRSGPLGGIGEGLRTGVGVLNAFREAIEETIGEAMESGDVSPERARTLMRDAAQRVQSSLEETRERLDFVSRREMEELRQELAALRQRVAVLEGGGEGEIVQELSAGAESEVSGDEGIIIVSD